MKPARRLIGRLSNFILNKIGLHVVRIRKNYEYRVPAWAEKLALPQKHPLFNILETAPDYQKNLQKIAEKVFAKYSLSTMVDVGANIGDTASLIRSTANIPIICIEGDEEYFKYLEKNTKNLRNVTRVFTLVGDGKVEGNLSLKRIRAQGTMRLVPSKKKIKTNTNRNTIDSIIFTQPILKPVKLIKVDTDGFDTQVLRGAKNIIKRDKPVIFMEYTPDLIINHDSSYLFFIRKNIMMTHPNMTVFDHLGTTLFSARANNAAARLVELTDYLLKPNRLLPYVDLAFATETDRSLIEI